MNGIHEVRGSIPLVSTIESIEGRRYRRPFVYR